jgi:hypothetical protein
MATNDVYLRIADTMPDGIELEVLKALATDMIISENRITLKNQIYRIFGYFPKGSIYNSKEDRQKRLAIQNLQESGIPVLSDSGKGGYLAELIRRRNSQDDKISKLRTVNFSQFIPREAPYQSTIWERLGQ